MGDSDDESEHHRSRDKFRRERSDYDNGRRRPGDKREPFDERTATIGGSYTRTEHRQGSAADRARSPVGEPPYKRPRKDYDDYRSAGPRRRETRNVDSLSEEGMYRPPLMPFKRFLDPLDDTISEEEACKKYREYKETYSKRHIEEFFEAHKSEEWLRLRYHPDYINKRKEAINASLRHRLAVFMELYEKGFFENQSVQMDNSENLIKLMDSVVIKLEGGLDDDLKVLDEDERNRFSDGEEIGHRNASISSTQPSNPVSPGRKSEEGEAESDIDGEESEKEDDKTERTTKDKAADPKLPLRDELSNCPDDRGSHRSPTHSPHSRSSKGSRSSSVASSDGESVQESHSNKDGEIDHEGSKQGEDSMEQHSPKDSEDEDVPTPTTAEAPDGGMGTESALSPSTSSVLLGSRAAPETPVPTESNDIKSAVDSGGNELPKNVKRSWPLHKTVSIFFRALPPTVTEAELRELCASQPGFMRLALWEPVPERRFMRHAWATYNPTVNIKKVCWALNTSPLLREKFTLPNGELGATVNRELAQRVRPLTPLTRHKCIMRQDLMLAAELIARLDSEHNLWGDASEEVSSTLVQTKNADAAQPTTNSPKGSAHSELLELAIHSKNPLLKNLTDYLVEEGGSEEEALLAKTNQAGDGKATDNASSERPNPVVLESDPELAKTLDHLILYLRVVHSVDFYAGAVYPMEDSMPHRCGILHARGDRGLNSSLPGGRPSGLVFTQKEIDDHLRNFRMKLRMLIDVPKNLTEEEMKKLGMRDPEKAAEDFIEANIQKRTGKKKPFKVVWVCPLSDKKFREPIFVRKHIFNKHMEKVEAAKKDNAIFFNNYLRDPRRPALPEAPHHVAQQYYHSSGGGGGAAGSSSYRGSRMNSRLGGGGGYRASNYSRGAGTFQDYYDVAAQQQQQQQQQAMAAMAAAAAAALYPNATAADLYALAAAGAGAGTRGTNGPGNRRGQRGVSPSDDFSNRPYFSNDNRRRQNTTYIPGNRRPGRPGDRGMVSYNDLDDPGGERP
ncbi:unnamed protein product [Calicophoron daubneyi]|uniref:Serrate RNA effector molecule homolog n=1 Tax=Calicophoron daubneyi TaxID=300641 RepID=A0AAV2TWL8_CALDB